MTEQTGVTRRELRLAERAESRAVRLPAWGTHLAPLSRTGLRRVLAGPGLVLSGLGLLLAGLPRVLSGLRLRLSGLRRPRVDWGGHLTQLSRLATRPEVVAVVCAAFLAGGVTQGQIEQGQRQEHRELVAAAEQARLDHVGRVTGALEARLTGQATVFAADKRNEALELARTAVETADVVVQTAAPVVAAETISPLDSAKAQLAGLIATAPDPLDVLPRPAEPPVSTGPQHDGVADPAVTGEIGASALASTTSAGSPVDAPKASGATQGGAAGSAKTSAASTAPTDARPSSVARGGIASRVPASAAALREPSSTAGASVPQAPPTTMPPTPLDALDVGTSLRMIAAAEEVIALSAQVQATAEATIAAAEAAARAAAEAAAAAAAAQAAAEEEARRVAAVADAANGALPRDLLCGVSFARGVELRCDAADALEDLNVAFRGRFGRDLRVVSSYRDYAEQVATKQAKGSLAGAPGTSNHGLGLAVDLDGFGALGQFDLPTYRWMREHAGDYGWHHPSYMQPGGAGPAEPWHWEYGTED